jgi:hypothetical protein
MPAVWDIGVNLFTDAIFSIFTIVFLSWLINYRENLSWKSVKVHVLKQISKHLYSIFNNFTNLCQCTHGDGVGRDETREQFFRRIFFIQLEELNEKVELNPTGQKFLDKFISFFEKKEQHINLIEMKYSKFLDPKLVESLMVIQDNIQTLILNVRTRKNIKEMFGVSDEDYFKLISLIIHRIVKEIYKITKFSGIEIYPEELTSKPENR